MPTSDFIRFRSYSTFRAPISTALLLIAVFGCASTAVDGTPTPTRPSAAILEESACAFPFPDHAAWLAFMDEAKDPAWRAPAMSQLVDQVSYERFQQGDTVTCKRIVYESDGLAIVGYALSPTRHPGKAPVVLFAHGGVAQWGRITFFDLLELHRLSERGYVVLASALRGEGGSEGSPNLGAGDLADTLRLIDVATEIAIADTERLGFWGVSRGGALGYRALATTERFDAALLVGAPSDLVEDPRRAEFHQHVYPGVVDGYAADQDAALEKLSALYWVDELSSRTPILLLHGGADERVRPSDSIHMAEQLKALKRDHELIVFENGSHTLIEHLLTVREHIDSWFDRHLKGSDGQTRAAIKRVVGKASASTEIAPKRIALSFDDAPLGDGPVFSGSERTTALLEALRKSTDSPAAIFVTTQGFENNTDGRDRIRRYAQAGHLIANHTDTHPWAHETEVERYLADIDQAESKLRGFSNRRPWFRFPYLDQGREAQKRERLLAGLKQRGLRSGYVTVDTYDWHIDRRWKDAAKAGHAIDRDAIRSVYVSMVVEAAEHYAEMSQTWLGRQPAHVLLLHENDAAALFIESAVAALEKAGWSIISPEDAYRDPIASVSPTTVFSGKGRIAALAHDRGARGAAAFDHWSSSREGVDRELDALNAFSGK